MIDLTRLAMTDDEVARVARPERESRVVALIAEANALVDQGIEEHVGDKMLVGICVLYSGGNDSTVLAHLFRNSATHAIHANTTIGIEATRQFVRDTCAAWGLALLEVFPGDGNTYRELVLAQGFPGPGHHFKMFQRLKERGLRQARRELVKQGHRERVVFLAGRRRTESGRRANVPEMEREGSVVWISPLVNWTKLDLNTYRLMHHGEVPTNAVSDLLHMSGECLCGAFAHLNELEEIGEWFPEVKAEIEALQAEIADRDDIPDYRKVWGWGGDPVALALSRTKKSKKSGRLCSSCDARAAGGEVIAAETCEVPA